MPAHLPAAVGPARVCVMAQTLEVKIPNEIDAAMISPSDNEGFATNAAGAISPAHSDMPTPTKALRTRVGVAPLAIHRSEAQPPAIEVPAMPQNGKDPKIAIAFIEKPRSFTR